MVCQTASMCTKTSLFLCTDHDILNNDFDFQYDLGISKPAHTVWLDCETLFSSMALHYGVLVVKAELDQILWGIVNSECSHINQITLSWWDHFLSRMSSSHCWHSFWYASGQIFWVGKYCSRGRRYYGVVIKIQKVRTCHKSLNTSINFSACARTDYTIG